MASEECAESWPGQGLLESAIECVRCWRLSSGHWAAVRAEHRCYGYDIKRGNNGIWYATGIFGRGGDRRRTDVTVCPDVAADGSDTPVDPRRTECLPSGVCWRQFAPCGIGCSDSVSPQ